MVFAHGVSFNIRAAGWVSLHAVFPLTDSGRLKSCPAIYGGYSGLTKIRTRRRSRRQYK
ncbi:hypothetical protein I7Q31_09710 [Neisseria meningitidis]|uniref:hypothetical protein n=1 Tax=Neisseria meningitidis TaxID=487 RepID=UPI0002EF7F6C|nr:hypothetical protein [Neisseria meningitidis]MBG9197499.1 hypothetical protein [Neisseria meningitidis]MBH6218095.1 hypothetical protein [Neisseria meningitidis]MBH6233423.1 hypothetical protein [Neisseria meningitidis]MBH6733331.1 hypothetical protein [Neisseria meningitidis]MBJ7759880.1 hypothetical protein [Neisseria meningitidis]